MAKDDENQQDIEKQISLIPGETAESQRTDPGGPAGSKTMRAPIFVAAGTSTLNRKIGGAFAGRFFLLLALLPPLVPFCAIYIVVCAIFSIKTDRLFILKNTADGVSNSLKSDDVTPLNEKMENSKWVGAARSGCIVLCWLIVNLSVPELRRLTILGSLLWKWSLLAVIISLGYPITVSIVFLLINIHAAFICIIAGQRHLIYFIMRLMFRISAIAHFASILLLWKLYFKTEHGLKPSDKVDRYCTWTMVSILVGSILGGLQKMLLLRLEAKAVNRRFKARILMSGLKLYFFYWVLDESLCPNLIPWREHGQQREELITSSNPDNNIRLQESLLSKKVALGDIMMVASRLMSHAKRHTRGADTGPEIVIKCQDKFPTAGRSVHVSKESIKANFKLTENDAKLLLEVLHAEDMTHSPHEISYDLLEKWMVDAHKSCTSLGHTLLDVKAMITSLNRVMTISVIIVVSLLWLLITDLATTNATILILSPFLASTFVFGDTCKTFFQGVVFSFVTHPFDVGDRCIIDDIELEVKNIGILTTTFIRIGTKEKILYPNSDLATKRIANLEGVPNPKDVIELKFDSSTTESQILALQASIKCFLDDDNKRNLYEKAHQVTVKDITNSITINIQFTHFMSVQDVTHSQYAQKKIKQRSEFFMNIKSIIEKLKIKLAG